MRTIRTIIWGGLALLAASAGLALASPAGAAPLTGATSLSARFGTTCVVTDAHQARCWGNNSHGQVGDGTTTERTTARLVRKVYGAGALLEVAQVAVGDEHACARLTNGQAVCWGNNGSGQVGDDTTTERTRPVVVLNGLGSGPLTGVAQLSAGSNHTCARLTSGRVACWGANGDGQSGGGGGSTHTLPTLVLSETGVGALEDVAQVSAGRTSTCARKAGGQVRCWGDNGLGQLGDGTQIDRDLPQPVVGALGSGVLTDVAQVATADQHVCVRLTNGQARCWGWGNEGELGAGDGLNSTTPVTVERPNGTPLVNVAQVAVGTNHSCFRLDSGRVRCTGYSGTGALGNPDADDEQLVPLLVRNGLNTGSLGGAVKLVVGNAHSCILHTNGLVGCWGQNFFGQLGDGTNDDHLLPAAVEV